MSVHKGAVVTNMPKRPIVSRGAKIGREGDVKKANKLNTSATMLANSCIVMAFLRLDPTLSNSHPAH